MSDNGGFVDLRIGQGAQGIGDESVWPSFTDIMTVIVMIFLMGLVVLMIRNFELDRQLLSSMSEREASLLENQGLVDRLGNLEETLAGVQQNLLTTESEREALRIQLLQELNRIELMASDNVDLEQQLAAIIEQRQLLARERMQLLARNAEVGEDLGAEKDTTRALAREVMTLAEENVSTREENLSLMDRIRELLGRNAELDEQREEAESRVVDLTATEARLNDKLEEIARQFDALKLESDSEINTLSNRNLSLTDQLEHVSGQLEQVREMLETEQAQRQALGLQVESQQAELVARQALLEQLQRVQQDSERQILDAGAEIDKLSVLIDQRQRENEALQAEAQTAGAQFRSLQQEYESLEARYRNLVRPARSSAGKQVVEIWIAKQGNEFGYRLRESAQEEAHNVSRAVLEARLAELKAEHGQNLYTRIVIPETSGLSHNEAWQFTREILTRYDYYYQDDDRGAQDIPFDGSNSVIQ